MTAAHGSDNTPSARLLRFGAVLVVLAGYVLIFRLDEDRIALRGAENATTLERIAAIDRTIASRPVLEHERRRLHAAMPTMLVRADRTELVARFVHDAARISTLDRTAIASIAAAATPPGPTPTGSAESTPLDLSVHGRFADVLKTVRDLAGSRVPVSIDLTSLNRSNGDGDDATVVAGVHIVLERLTTRMASDVPTRSH